MSISLRGLRTSITDDRHPYGRSSAQVCRGPTSDSPRISFPRHQSPWKCWLWLDSSSDLRTHSSIVSEALPHPLLSFHRGPHHPFSYFLLEKLGSEPAPSATTAAEQKRFNRVKPNRPYQALVLP